MLDILTDSMTQRAGIAVLSGYQPETTYRCKAKRPFCVTSTTFEKWFYMKVTLMPRITVFDIKAWAKLKVAI